MLLCRDCKLREIDGDDAEHVLQVREGNGLWGESEGDGDGDGDGDGAMGMAMVMVMTMAMVMVMAMVMAMVMMMVMAMVMETVIVIVMVMVIMGLTSHTGHSKAEILALSGYRSSFEREQE